MSYIHNCHAGMEKAPPPSSRGDDGDPLLAAVAPLLAAAHTDQSNFKIGSVFKGTFAL